jgi:excisionase family DNA binding protein
MNERTQWLTVEQAAEELQVSIETVRRWIRAGEMPALAMGSRRGGYRLKPEDVDRFIEERYGRVGKALAA